LCFLYFVSRLIFQTGKNFPETESVCVLKLKAEEASYLSITVNKSSLYWKSRCVVTVLKLRMSLTQSTQMLFIGKQIPLFTVHCNIFRLVYTRDCLESYEWDQNMAARNFSGMYASADIHVSFVQK
jgi:hypothetical protein